MSASPLKEVIYQMYVVEHKTDKEIAETLRCSRSKVIRLRKEYGIKGSRKPHKHLDTIRKLFVEEGKSDRCISEILGISHQRVCQIRKRHDIERPHKGIPKDTLERLYLTENKTDEMIAKGLGCSKTKVIRHRKKYGIKRKTLRELYTKEMLEEKYTEEEKGTVELAKELGIHANSVLKLLYDHGIEVRENKGNRGESKVIEKADSMGYTTKNMNEDDPHSIYDLEINGYKVEVKSGRRNKQGAYQILLMNPKHCYESDHRIRLKNGYTRKLFRKTCDFLIAVAFDDDNFYIIPSDKIPDDAQYLYFGPWREDFREYKNRWDLIKKSVATNNGPKVKHSL